MTKVKTVKFERIETETALEYPIYLYFQDEDFNDELIMVTEKCKITVKYNISGFTIEFTDIFHINEYHLKNLTTKEHFLEVYNEVIKNLEHVII